MSISIVLGLPNPRRHPAFWTGTNQKIWLQDPEIVEKEQVRRRGKARAESDMADPFEVRMRFSGQLQHLNASVVSAQKAAQYAMKHRDMSEDLHSCILEQLERVCWSEHAAMHDDEDADCSCFLFRIL